MRVSKNKYFNEYYDKNKEKLDQLFSSDKYQPILDKLNISPKQLFEARVEALANSTFDTKAKAKEAFDDIVVRAKYGEDYADRRQALMKLKAENKNIDLRRKEFKINAFSDWINLPDPVLYQTNNGSWKGGTVFEEYIEAYSVNYATGTVLYKGFGNVVGDKESPFSTSGMMDIDELERVLGMDIDELERVLGYEV